MNNNDKSIDDVFSTHKVNTIDDIGIEEYEGTLDALMKNDSVLKNIRNSSITHFAVGYDNLNHLYTVAFFSVTGYYPVKVVSDEGTPLQGVKVIVDGDDAKYTYGDVTILEAPVGSHTVKIGTNDNETLDFTEENQYLDAEKIKTITLNSKKIELNVVNGTESKEPLKNIMVSVEVENKKLCNGTTDDKGHFSCKAMVESG